MALAEVAQSAQDSAIAAEMYLASVCWWMTSRTQSAGYIDELAGALQIDPTILHTFDGCAACELPSM
nr:DUF533 domain-containing protein [Pseudomonas brassicacearum]